MGNRAVIATDNKSVGIYLHWNGGRDSIEGFLTYCKMRGFRPPESDSYGWASLTSVIANYFGQGMSCGIQKYEYLDTDNFDNGVYLIKDWEIVGREHFNGKEQHEYALLDMLIDIDKHQPKDNQLGKDKIKELLREIQDK
jgi:hypothetical protein